MSRKIVTDSSSNVRRLKSTAFESVPLKIISDDTEFSDTASLNIKDMFAALNENNSGSTSCPNTHEWVKSFENANEVFAVAISGNISGSCSAAIQAAEDYTAEHPDSRVCVINSLSAGPELRLIAERLDELVLQGLPFDKICSEIAEYRRGTYQFFCLRSLKNFVRSGRVSPTVARLVGIMNISVIGKASEDGKLEKLTQGRGEKASLKILFEQMKLCGYCGGRVGLAHCDNESACLQFARLIHADFPRALVTVEACGGLCSYYAEQGGILVGFEGKKRARSSEDIKVFPKRQEAVI